MDFSSEASRTSVTPEAVMKARVDEQRRLVLDAADAERLHLQPGTAVDVRIVDPGQAWFWSEEWLAGEREAGEDIRSGRVIRHESDDAFLESLLGREDVAEA
jgi:bifunctional DNA-binding transcriptional regulator/antitoxin component of YhaV-PrlF toxin-antitoxin module